MRVSVTDTASPSLLAPQAIHRSPSRHLAAGAANTHPPTRRCPIGPTKGKSGITTPSLSLRAPPPPPLPPPRVPWRSPSPAIAAVQPPPSLPPIRILGEKSRKIPQKIAEIRPRPPATAIAPANKRSQRSQNPSPRAPNARSRREQRARVLHLLLLSSAAARGSETAQTEVSHAMP
ncbi:hypothetical protein EJB05_10722, partial [Eragrostis curvula]